MPRPDGRSDAARGRVAARRENAKGGREPAGGWRRQRFDPDESAIPGGSPSRAAPGFHLRVDPASAGRHIPLTCPGTEDRGLATRKAGNDLRLDVAVGSDRLAVHGFTWVDALSLPPTQDRSRCLSGIGCFAPTTVGETEQRSNRSDPLAGREVRRRRQERCTEGRSVDPRIRWNSPSVPSPSPQGTGNSQDRQRLRALVSLRDSRSGGGPARGKARTERTAC